MKVVIGWRKRRRFEKGLGRRRGRGGRVTIRGPFNDIADSALSSGEATARSNHCTHIGGRDQMASRKDMRRQDLSSSSVIARSLFIDKYQ